MWSVSCLKFKFGWKHSYSVYIVKIATIVFTMCLLTYAWSSRYRSIDAQTSSVQLYPVIQFDRSGFTKAEVLDSSKQAIGVLAKRGQSEEDIGDEDDVEDSNNPLNFMKYVLDIEDRKTRRQILALEALGLNGEEDLDVLSGLSSKIPNIGAHNDTNRRFSDDYYKNISETVEHRTPDYKKLCINSTFTVGNRHRVVDPSFCWRLMTLGRAIDEGREAPLLTVFTWWLDPVSDGEVLSRKAMINNWNGFRPFVVPVVFTNDRMNMAHANGNGWPCFPATETEVNPDGLPVFGALSRVIEKKFVSTFYGYARQITMFDASLLETLLAVKERYVQQPELNTNTRKKDDVSTKPKPIVISGRSVKMPHFAPDAFVHFEHLYEYLRANPLRGGGNLSVESSNYLFYRGVDFTGMPPLVVHDDFLFQYAVNFSVKQGHAVVDASRTLLALRTYRNDNNNEWGRRYLYSKQPDLSYNRRMVTAWDRKTQQQQLQQQQQHPQKKAPQRSQLKSLFVTRFDRTNNSCLLETIGGTSITDKDLT